MGYFMGPMWALHGHYAGTLKTHCMGGRSPLVPHAKPGVPSQAFAFVLAFARATLERCPSPNPTFISPSRSPHPQSPPHTPTHIPLSPTTIPLNMLMVWHGVCTGNEVREMRTFSPAPAPAPEPEPEPALADTSASATAPTPLPSPPPRTQPSEPPSASRFPSASAPAVADQIEVWIPALVIVENPVETTPPEQDGTAAQIAANNRENKEKQQQAVRCLPPSLI